MPDSGLFICDLAGPIENDRAPFPLQSHASVRIGIGGLALMASLDAEDSGPWHGRTYSMMTSPCYDDVLLYFPAYHWTSHTHRYDYPEALCDAWKYTVAREIEIGLRGVETRVRHGVVQSRGKRE